MNLSSKDRPVVVLGIDPGAGGAGYCAWGSAGGPIYIGSECPTALAVDAIVVESGFVGRMGRKAMWGLGFDAGWRLYEARVLLDAAGSFNLAQHIYSIRPDGKNGWRAALPSVPGTFQEYDGPPGDVIVKRLRARYSKMLPGLDWATPTEHEVEAVGIAEAAAAILQRPKAGQRKALVRVKR